VTGLRLGQRVWVFIDRKREHGGIATLSPVLLDGAPTFTVLLDGFPSKVVSCSEDRRGTQWGFADEAQI
jgi:hypothetical protein